MMLLIAISILLLVFAVFLITAPIAALNGWCIRQILNGWCIKQISRFV